MTTLNWQFWLTFSIGIIGAAAWLPTIFEYFKTPIIKGKILSTYASVVTIQGKKQAAYVVKLSLFTQNKTLNLKDINISMKFPDTKEIEGNIFMFRSASFMFNENGQDIIKKLRVPIQEYIYNFSSLPKEETVIGYITFTANEIIDKPFEYLTFTFIDYKNKEYKLKFMGSELTSNKLLFDDSIWE